MLNRFIENREIRIRAARIDPSEDPTPEMDVVPHVEPDEIANLIKDVVKYTAIAVGIVAGGLTILNTISEITINLSKKNDKD